MRHVLMGVFFCVALVYLVVALLFSIVCCIAGANSYAGVRGLIIVLLGVLCAVLLAPATYIRV